MGSYRIAVLPGDGIGPEVMQATLRVLEHVAAAESDLALQRTIHEAGAELYRRTGVVLPAAVLQDCGDADAVLAAIGLPDVRQPDGTEIQPEMMVDCGARRVCMPRCGRSSRIPAYPVR